MRSYIIVLFDKIREYEVGDVCRLIGLRFVEVTACKMLVLDETRRKETISKIQG
jgi:hypothetical protein